VQHLVMRMLGEYGWQEAVASFLLLQHFVRPSHSTHRQVFPLTEFQFFFKMDNDRFPKRINEVIL
jgi:hypothetical protein